MSIQFNDATNYKGLVQLYEKAIGANRGDISGNNDKLKEFTADVNVVWDDFLILAFKASGKWQFDDSNHTDYPIITTSLVSGQRDYSFTVDGSSNLILDIYKVAVADSSGYFREIPSVDQQTPNNTKEDVSSFVDGQNTGGTPIRYDKTANGLFLDPIPNYSYSNGLKVFINREADYFVYTDDTKKPGCHGAIHRYFAIKPARDYALRNNLANFKTLDMEVQMLEQKIQDVYGRRDRDTVRRLQANQERCD